MYIRHLRVTFDKNVLLSADFRNRLPVLELRDKGKCQYQPVIPCDFIVFAQSLNRIGRHHDMLLANVFAQAEALAFGKITQEVEADGTPPWLVPYESFEGNRPSNTILLERLTPAALGTLVALYEHSVFTQGTIWGIDSFDQWGVELGKVLAQRIIPELENKTEPNLQHDSSMNAVIWRYWEFKESS